ncbi:hypothetical protein [Halobacillus sp. K22]
MYENSTKPKSAAYVSIEASLFHANHLAERLLLGLKFDLFNV